MNRLGTDKKIAPFAAQFVPVKLDINSSEFRAWSRDLKNTGKDNGVPHIYVVRSDGETLYGNGGGLAGDKLGMMLSSTLENSGRVLTAKEVEKLSAAAEQFQNLQGSGDIAGAVKAINKIGRIGVPGQIASYAEAANQVNKLATSSATEVVTKLQESGATIESGETAEIVEAVLASMKLQSDYSGLKILKPEFAKFKKALGKNKEISQLVKEAKVINSAATASSNSAKKRALTKLQELIDTTEIDEIKAAAKLELDELKAEPDPS